MMKYALVTLSLLLAFITNAQTIHRLDKSTISRKTISSSIKKLLDTAHVTGMVVAVFNDGKPVYKEAFGYSNADTKQQLKTGTEFYGASLSKAVFAALVMKLVEEGKLDLDKPLQQYLPKPIYDYAPVTPRAWHEDYSSLKNDTLYSRITARMCLDHTSGFPNWRFFLPDQQLHVTQQPGKRYLYSGEGLVYLQVVMEKMFNIPLDSMIKAKVLQPLGMNTSAYKWEPRFEKDFCYGHDAKGKPYEKDKDNAPRSASTLETTPDDYVRFMTGIMNNKILSPATTAEMFSPQIAIRSVAQFGPYANVDSSANDNIQLSYGLGWGLYKTPNGWAAFKEGHGDGFQHFSAIYPESKTGILIMSNSDNAESVYKEMMEITVKDTSMPWKWENYIP
ncbi:MAG TPA: serine hydrolase domain-containing protein, partial [Ferruginibacter sp.]|nr:serine hydrolase domain-containing protein [Ferruginibacter sp.]